jgi:hypothetical protein
VLKVKNEGAAKNELLFAMPRDNRFYLLHFDQAGIGTPVIPHWR